ncbi:MAG: hypothetical protein SGARI_003614, partial [Bacillariaceae sp.]
MTPKEQEAVDVLMKMIALIKESQLEQASDLLADNVQWKTPMGSYDGKQDWVENFKQPEKGPVFEEPQIGEQSPEGDNNIVITRKGTKKVGFLKVKILKTVEVNDDNKICKMQ